MISTENALDMAIGPRSFSNSATRRHSGLYDRRQFWLSGEGELVTAGGLLLQPAIIIPQEANSITIGRDGTVSVDGNGGGSQQLGQIQLARLLATSGLEALELTYSANGQRSTHFAESHRTGCGCHYSGHVGSIECKRS